MFLQFDFIKVSHAAWNNVNSQGLDVQVANAKINQTQCLPISESTHWAARAFITSRHASCLSKILQFLPALHPSSHHQHQQHLLLFTSAPHHHPHFGIYFTVALIHTSIFLYRSENSGVKSATRSVTPRDIISRFVIQYLISSLTLTTWTTC